MPLFWFLFNRNQKNNMNRGSVVFSLEAPRCTDSRNLISSQHRSDFIRQRMICDKISAGTCELLETNPNGPQRDPRLHLFRIFPCYGQQSGISRKCFCGQICNLFAWNRIPNNLLTVTLSSKTGKPKVCSFACSHPKGEKMIRWTQTSSKMKNSDIFCCAEWIHFCFCFWLLTRGT